MVLDFSSCKENGRREDAVKIVAEWTGKKIRFPTGIACQFLGSDADCVDPAKQTCKILLYVDSSGCTSCRLRLPEWKNMIAEADSLFSGEVDFLFFFQAKKSSEKALQNIFRNNGFNHHVFIDPENEIDKINKFPSQTDYQCFLLDSDNKVLLIGNPSMNTDIWQLYKKYVAERNNILTQGKKEESTLLSFTLTLPLDSQSNKKGGGKGTDFFSIHSVPG